MAKNQSRDFATMSDDERRRFALQEPEGTDEAQSELDFDNPRNADHMGKHYATPRDEVADPEARDGGAALLDDVAHDEAVRRAEEQGKG